MRLRAWAWGWLAALLLGMNAWTGWGSRPQPARPMPPPEPACLSLTTATARELATLPGIGFKLGRRIADYRDRHPRMPVTDLTKVRGIGKTKANRLAGLLQE